MLQKVLLLTYCTNVRVISDIHLDKSSKLLDSAPI